ncbi:MAG: VirD4-like conjugal transfer protein, CD1115 family, partial [Dysosmobacter welbionis]|uniref:VirD4-like conjugal transfer protein, CD1115 family n=1 Tax=Dysosmobacter welbionis TaxID=2093857 RepID=UPI00399BCE5B
MRLKKTSQTTDLVLALFLYIPVVWAALLIAQSLGGGLPELLSNLTAALEQPFQIQWTDKSLFSILVCTGAYLMGLCLYASGQGRTRDGEEHGSAAWGSPRQLNAQFRQKQNKILTRHVRLGLDTHKHRRSLNVLVIGGSGAAKTRGYVKPNILEANSNYVITDPKMEVLTATGGYLKRQGYDIRVLNLVDLSQSDGYNPFRYLRDEKDALKLVNTLIQATTPKGSHESDPFWSKSETALLQAIILMLFQEAPEYEQNFSMVLRVLEYAEVKEDDDEYVSPLDMLFRAMEYENPESVALRQYKVFKQAAGKTAKSILISCGARLAPFDIAELRELMSYDEMELDTIGDRKTALFVIISDTDDTFNFVVAIMYSQLFNLLCDKADDVYNGRLPVHVRCLLDEFANIGQIPKFDKLIATIRSREISASIILQSQSQLKTIYKDAADTIT